jgi:hypothetical protein
VTFALDHDGAHFDLRAQRDGLRTRLTLRCDGAVVGEVSGFGAVLVPADATGGGEPEQRPTVVALTVLPGVVSRAILFLPRPEGAPGGPPPHVVEALPKPLARFATAERHEFAPPPGSLAARLEAFRRDHPRLWASRHVALGAGKVVVALLGVAALLRLLVEPVMTWLGAVLRGLLPAIDIPWPDIDLPAIPWPDIDLPDLRPPGWLLVVLATAKFWVPILVGIGLAVVEVRRRRRAAARQDEEERGAHG